MGNDVAEGDPLGVLTEIGYRVVWVPDFAEELWVVDECKTILADDRLSPRCVADALWSELCDRLLA